jgi:hypothetical protein
MTTKWQAKGIGVSLRRGTSQKKPVTNEDDGTRAGYHVEHWDDRQDAVAQPKRVESKTKATLEEE